MRRRQPIRNNVCIVVNFAASHQSLASALQAVGALSSASLQLRHVAIGLGELRLLEGGALQLEGRGAPALAAVGLLRPSPGEPRRGVLATFDSAVEDFRQKAPQML